MLAESFNYPGMHGLVRFIKRIIPIVFFIEFLAMNYILFVAFKMLLR